MTTAKPRATLAIFCPIMLLFLSAMTAICDEPLPPGLVKPEPIALLPDRAQSTAGQLSLFADFKHREGDVVPVYIINRTAAAIEFDGQDGDLYIKLEAKVGRKWMRSMPHVYSWCGNSYSTETIPAGHFILRTIDCGHWPLGQGAPAPEDRKTFPVRFRFYTTIHKHVISNASKMLVQPRLIELATNDAMALEHADVKKLAAIATQRIKVTPLGAAKPVDGAIYLLKNFPGDPIAQKALRKVLANETDDSRIAYALEAAAIVFDPMESFAIYLELLADEKYPFHRAVLGRLRELQGEEEKAKVEQLFQQILDDYSHPLFTTAVTAEGRRLGDAKHEALLQSVIDDPDAPEALRIWASENLEDLRSSDFSPFEDL